MNRDDYQKVKKIFQSVLEIAPGERSAYLNENCADSTAVRKEVDKLLNAYESGYLEQPAIENAAEAFAESKLSSGQDIGPYKIIKKIGAGGMGEVYLAEDARLKRKIALKILPAMLSHDKQYLRRFQQEAYAASALNHPNILTVHEFGLENGTTFIASEFVEGETLRQRLRHDEQLGLSEALDIAIQVAAALNAAHRSGIVHRDIKPENVVIREDGLVKVLDFGLAKLTARKNEVVDPDGETQFNTSPGMIMGTAAYMSPEQARGKETDARSDIWSLGIVLYEMQAGKTPFKGETTNDTIASILVGEAAPMNDAISPELRRILQKALQKDLDKRYQTAKEILADLKAFHRELEFSPSYDASGEVTLRTNVTPEGTGSRRVDQSGESQSVSNIVPGSSLSTRIMTVVGLSLVALAGIFAVWKFSNPDRYQAPPNLLASLRIKPLVNWDGEAGESETGAKFSPNGAMIAYSLTRNGQRNIWTKQVPDGKPNQITDGKASYYNPIWSSDGQRIAFVSKRDGQIAIWAMPFSGGELTPIKPMDNDPELLRWSKNGTTIFYQQQFNVFALDIASRQITQITNFDTNNPAQFINISPNEDRIVYSAGPNPRLHIFVMPLGGGPSVQVTNDESSDEYPFWLPDGERIIYSSRRDGIFQTSIAYLADNRTEQINLGITDTLINDVAPSGDKILFSQSREESDLWHVNTTDKSESQVTDESGLELWPDASADGNSIVFQVTTEAKHLLGGSVETYSNEDKQQIKIAANGFSPAFSPDGRKIAFLRYADNLNNIWVTSRSGGDERQLTTGGVWFSGFTFMPYNRVQVRDYSWSPDGNSLVYCGKPDGVWNVWRVAAGGGEPERLTNNDGDSKLLGPMVAPDAKRIAYAASRSIATGGTNMTANISDLGGVKTEVVFSSDEAFFKLIGWNQGGTGLLIAVPEDRSTAKPTDIKLVLVSAGNRQIDLATLKMGYFNNIALSPDGRKLAYAAHEDGKDAIRVIAATGGGESARTVASFDPNVYVSGITWSPDSRSIYYSKQKKLRMISMIENFK